MAAETGISKLLYWLRVAAIGRRPKRTLVRLGILVVLVFVTYKFILIPVKVTGMSMEPTFANGSVNFINRLAYVRNPPRRGDVVGIRLQAGAKVLLLKRIVALPGESISFKEGHVCIDGVAQPEPYLKLSCGWNMPAKQLGPEEYYFVGDNRSMDPQDHTQGVTGRWRIEGRVLLPGKKSVR
jgi:signal peptidase I